jgi:hypothetical protein
VQALNEKAIITRNRYGAEVLNIEDLMILDIDQLKPSFWDLFRKRDKATDKQKMVEKIRKQSQKPAYQNYTFRIYETKKGLRVIVLGKTFNPRAHETTAMMNDFDSDQLYVLLCEKQGCFRARLTPKPARIKLRGHQIKFPRESAKEQKFQTWLADYQAASLNFSVCKLIEQIGSNHPLPEAVQVHDEITGIHRNLPLA